MELMQGSKQLIKSADGLRSENQDSSLKLMSSDTNGHRTTETIKRSMNITNDKKNITIEISDEMKRKTTKESQY